MWSCQLDNLNHHTHKGTVTARYTISQKHRDSDSCPEPPLPYKPPGSSRIILEPRKDSLRQRSQESPLETAGLRLSYSGWFRPICTPSLLRAVWEAKNYTFSREFKNKRKKKEKKDMAGEGAADRGRDRGRKPVLGGSSEEVFQREREPRSRSQRPWYRSGQLLNRGDLQQLSEQLISPSCLLSSLSEKLEGGEGGMFHWSFRFAELPWRCPCFWAKMSSYAPSPQLPSPFYHRL